MREYLSRVNPKGQIPIPAEFRRQLGVKPKDKVALKVEGDTLWVTPARFTYPALDFEDALVVARMQQRKIGELFSYDTDFDAIPEITRREP